VLLSFRYRVQFNRSRPTFFTARSLLFVFGAFRKNVLAPTLPSEIAFRWPFAIGKPPYRFFRRPASVRTLFRSSRTSLSAFFGFHCFSSHITRPDLDESPSFSYTTDASVTTTIPWRSKNNFSFEYMRYARDVKTISGISFKTRYGHGPQWESITYTYIFFEAHRDNTWRKTKGFFFFFKNRNYRILRLDIIATGSFDITDYAHTILYQLENTLKTVYQYTISIWCICFKIQFFLNTWIVCIYIYTIGHLVQHRVRCCFRDYGGRFGLITFNIKFR